MGKGGRKERFSLWVSPDLMRWYREQASNSGVSISNMVCLGLQFYREYRDAIGVLKDVLERFGGEARRVCTGGGMEMPPPCPPAGL